MNLNELFNAHPRTVGETYREHLATATGFGLALIVAGLACLAHGLLPFLFERTGSRGVERLHRRMAGRHTGAAKAMFLDAEVGEN